MELLINPNVSYVLLILGFLFAVLALFSPGTGFLELAALGALGLAAYGIVNLPVNLWALGVLALSVVPLALALKRFYRYRLAFLAASAVAFGLGSAFLFQGASGRLAVSPLLILLLAGLSIGIVWFSATKALEAMNARPSYDLDRLVGMTGEVSSDIRGQGTVYVDGEEWTAVSKKFIPSGHRVRVLQRNGLSLEVESLDP